MTNVFRLILFAILLASTSLTHAQDAPLPDQPILKASISKDKIAWCADGTTLWLETDSSGQGYAYDPATGNLSELDQSPFTLTLTDEQIEHFQASEPIVFKSPYNQNILYRSSLYISCGNECNGQLIMGGDFCDAPDCYDYWGFYRPLDIFGDFDVRWSRNGDAAIIRMIGSYGPFDDWYHVDFNQRYEDVFIDALDAYADDVLAISDDGKRILYVKTIPSSNLHRLMYWNVETYTTGNNQSDMLTLTATHNEKITEGDIVSAAFSEGQYDILYIDDEGITGYSMFNGSSTLLNPEINSTWVSYGLFSPDNRYIAIQANEALFVLESNIEP